MSPDGLAKPARMVSAAAAAGALTAALVLAACNTTPTAAPVLLTLPPAAPLAAPGTTSTAAPPGAPALPLLTVRRVAIPEYLLARRVRYRTDSSTLADWPNTFWAERIEVAVSREFVSALRPALPQWQVCDSSCPDRPSLATLQVELVPMDYWRPDRTLRARARLTISAAPPAVPRSVELTFELPTAADSPQAQAQAISELLAKVAAATAAQLARLPG